MPVVHTSCTVDGRVKFICSVQQEDEVTFHWTVHTVLSNYTLDDAVAKHHILYLWGQTPGDLGTVDLAIENLTHRLPPQKHSANVGPAPPQEPFHHSLYANLSPKGL
ncbi:hypothetical protein SKAU_G00267340 [Synaphobranchus kaupii]|uniref:Uncharacterized protein n=1 Tax=Synaphobranchus kaupii TaxID=118154 RepID=A0A9Q1EZJ5_SYNKA|nr:hypothetical protein SKAU_G00267340 [Synaphobranchus kaupii]